MKVKNKKRLLFIFFLLALIVAAYLISHYYIQIMLIQGKSMEPAYKNLSLVFIDKQSDDYKKGDVIAFSNDGIKGIAVKRIVATPGDSLYIAGGILYVNGSISEHTVGNTPITYSGIAENKIVLLDNQYFVLGDNYAESKDSRYQEIGLVEKNRIIGKIK